MCDLIGCDGKSTLFLRVVYRRRCRFYSFTGRFADLKKVSYISKYKPHLTTNLKEKLLFIQRKID